MTIGKGVKKISNSAFERCYQLKEIQIPDTVEELGWGCFLLSGVESVILGSGIKEIRGTTFYACRELKNIVMEGEINAIYNQAFQGTGIKSIRKTVAKYHGNMQMYYDQESLTFHAVITIKQ